MKRWWRRWSGQETFEQEVRERLDIIFRTAGLAAWHAGRDQPDFMTRTDPSTEDPMGQASQYDVLGELTRGYQDINRKYGQ